MANWVSDFLTRNPDVVSKISSRGKHHISYREGSDIISTFTGSPCHYLDEGIWKPIDTTLILIGTEYGTPWSKTRIKTDGTVRIIDDSQTTLHTQKTSRIGLLSATGTFTPVITSIPTGNVSGDSISRLAGGKFSHSLRLTETGLRETLTISSSADVTGTGTSYFVIETAFGTTQLWADGWLNDEFNKAGSIFPIPYATDAKNAIIPLKRYTKYTGGYQYIYTGILISELSKYAFPLIIDPDYLDSTNDGYVRGRDLDYATARSTANTSQVGITTFTVGQQYISSYYNLYRSYLRFDTSSIPDDDTVTQVNLKLVCVQNNSDTDFDVNILKQNWSGQDPITSGNRETAYGNCLTSPEDSSIWINTSGISNNTQYTSGNLLTSWVSKINSTYYSLASNRDYDGSGTEPSGLESINIASQEHTTESYRPILTIVHAAAGGGIPVLMEYYNRQRRIN